MKSHEIKTLQERNLKGQNQLILERLQEKYFGNNGNGKNQIKRVKKKTKNTNRNFSSITKPFRIDHTIIKENRKEISNNDDSLKQIDSITQTSFCFNISNHLVMPIKGFKQMTTTKDKYAYALSGKLTTNAQSNSNVNHNHNDYQIKNKSKDNDLEIINLKSTGYSNVYSNSFKFSINTERLKLKSTDRKLNRKFNQDIFLEEIKPNKYMSEINKERNIETIDSSRKLLKPNNNHNFLSSKKDKDKEDNIAFTLNDKQRNQKKNKLKYKKPNVPQKRYKNNSNNNSQSNKGNKNQIDSSLSINNEIIMNKILKKIIEKNKLIANSKSKEWSFDIGNDSDTHVLKSNMNFHSLQSHSPYSLSSDHPDPNRSTNYLELKLYNIQDWHKHEELWDNITLVNKLRPQQEIYLMPPNARDSIVSSYYKIYSGHNNINTHSNADKGINSNRITIIINDYIKCPFSEIKKWKNAYQRVVSRWDSNKLLEILNEITLDNEMKRVIILKKAEVIVNETNIVFNQIIELLKRVQMLKCNEKI